MTLNNGMLQVPKLDLSNLSELVLHCCVGAVDKPQRRLHRLAGHSLGFSSHSSCNV